MFLDVSFDASRGEGRWCSLYCKDRDIQVRFGYMEEGTEVGLFLHLLIKELQTIDLTDPVDILMYRKSMLGKLLGQGRGSLSSRDVRWLLWDEELKKREILMYDLNESLLAKKFFFLCTQLRNGLDLAGRSPEVDHTSDATEE